MPVRIGGPRVPWTHLRFLSGSVRGSEKKQMPYTHFRYIAWEVPTATFLTSGLGGVVCDYDPGEMYQAISRLPVPATVPDDARKRLQRLAGVVNLAANRLSGIGDNPNTLKIFMAPEFYFRPVAADPDYHSGTYPVKDQVAILQAMNEMFAHADFRDWLIVPGTVLWNTRADVRRDFLYFNTLVHVQGGQQNVLNVIEKNQPSGIDGMPVVGVPGRDVAYSVFHTSWKNRKKRVAMVSGTPVGFDVCLDHQIGPEFRILKYVLHNWRANEGIRQQVGLHLLCAAGMDVQPPSVAAKPNGYILRNDGIANPGARSQLIQVQRYVANLPLGLGQYNTNERNMSGFAIMAAPTAEESAVDIPGGALQVPSKGPTYATFAQRVVYYPTLAMP
jgi:hypothetical protein